jgi:hypothetical protein
MTQAFLDALRADGPAADRAGKMGLWRGEASADGETNWKRVVEFCARRI